MSEPLLGIQPGTAASGRNTAHAGWTFLRRKYPRSSQLSAKTSDTAL